MDEITEITNEVSEVATAAKGLAEVASDTEEIADDAGISWGLTTTVLLVGAGLGLGAKSAWNWIKQKRAAKKNERELFEQFKKAQAAAENETKPVDENPETQKGEA